MTKAQIYAGIGSRETPHHVLQMMRDFAGELAVRGLLLRSGHADGADQAFELGAFKAKGITAVESHLPWIGFSGSPLTLEPPFVVTLGHENYEKFEEIARKHHGNWGVCNPAAKKLLTRNVPVILGQDLKTPVDFVISWSAGPGGTAHTTAIAQTYGIPVFNLAKPNGLSDLMAFAKTL